ncbi:MAG TPA: hypothetical protein DCW29_01875 [Janthinobacterium sp.]|nr:hypothetical protein [Janthinobacterium sp.]
MLVMAAMMALAPACNARVVTMSARADSSDFSAVGAGHRFDAAPFGRQTGAARPSTGDYFAAPELDAVVTSLPEAAGAVATPAADHEVGFYSMLLLGLAMMVVGGSRSRPWSNAPIKQERSPA